MWNQLSIYCERTSVAFLAEPLNAFTNLAFLIAGLHLLLVFSKQEGTPSLQNKQQKILGVLLSIIAICSFLFHTTAFMWAAILDSVSILVFACVFLGFHLRNFLGWNTKTTVVVCFVFAAVSYFAPPHLTFLNLNGSEAYLPYYLVLIVLIWSLRNPHPQNSRQYAWATLAFTFSLFFRSFDRALCESIPTGTHFLWHLTNAWVLWQLARSVYPSISPGISSDR